MYCISLLERPYKGILLIRLMSSVNSGQYSVVSTESVWSWLAEAQSAINTAEKYKITNFLLPNRLCYQGGGFRVDGVFLDLRPSPLLPIRPTSTWF